MNEKITLVCTPLRFYTENDEELFFNWLKQIHCIEKIEGIGNALYLTISSKNIEGYELLDLMGIFDRYKFDAQQLKIFINETNKEWFE